MRNLSKNIFIVLFSFAGFTSVGTVYAQMAVTDPAVEANTWSTYLKEADSYIKTAQMAKNQLIQLQNEAKNLKTLNGQQWDSAQQALVQLSNAMQQSNALAYSMANVDQEFKQKYPGYDKGATTNYSQDYASWVRTNQATMNGVMDQMNESYTEQQQEAAANQFLAQRARSPEGQLEALQVQNEIAAEQVAQLQKLKATMMAQTNAQAEYYAYQAQKDAAQQQSVDAVVKNADQTYPHYTNNSNFGLLPQEGKGD